jgi:hypothetical protein
MFENNLEKGLEQLELAIDNLLNWNVPIKKLIISKNLRNDYKGFEKVYSTRLSDGKIDTTGSYTWRHVKEIKEKGVKTGKTEQIE